MAVGPVEAEVVRIAELAQAGRLTLQQYDARLAGVIYAHGVEGIAAVVSVSLQLEAPPEVRSQPPQSAASRRRS